MNWQKERFGNAAPSNVLKPWTLDDKCAVLSNVAQGAAELGYGPADRDTFISMILGEDNAREAREENSRRGRPEI